MSSNGQMRARLPESKGGPCPGLRIEIREEGHLAIVAPSGELDIATHSLLEREIEKLLDGRFGHVVVDLAEVTFIDIVSARAMARCEERARNEQVRFSLLSGTASTRRLLELCGLLERFELLESAS